MGLCPQTPGMERVGVWSGWRWVGFALAILYGTLMMVMWVDWGRNRRVLSKRAEL